jgi:amino acid transporter
MKTFKITKKIIIALILISIGAIMIISSFFIPDNPAQCSAPVTSTLFTSSLIVFGIGLLFLMVGIAIIDVEYHQQTKWITKRKYKQKTKKWHLFILLSLSVIVILFFIICIIFEIVHILGMMMISIFLIPIIFILIIINIFKNEKKNKRRKMSKM